MISTLLHETAKTTDSRHLIVRLSSSVVRWWDLPHSAIDQGSAIRWWRTMDCLIARRQHTSTKSELELKNDFDVWERSWWPRVDEQIRMFWACLPTMVHTAISVISASDIKAVAAIDVARHCCRQQSCVWACGDERWQTVFCSHITLDVISVRKPLSSTLAQKRLESESCSVTTTRSQQFPRRDSEHWCRMIVFFVFASHFAKRWWWLENNVSHDVDVELDAGSWLLEAGEASDFVTGWRLQLQILGNFAQMKNSTSLANSWRSDWHREDSPLHNKGAIPRMVPCPRRRAVVNNTAHTLSMFQAHDKIAFSDCELNTTTRHVRGNMPSCSCQLHSHPQRVVDTKNWHDQFFVTSILRISTPVIFHCDGKMSIEAVCTQGASERKTRSALRFAPKTSHQGNAGVEAVHGHSQGLTLCCQPQFGTHTGLQLSSISPTRFTMRCRPSYANSSPEKFGSSLQSVMSKSSEHAWDCDCLWFRKWTIVSHIRPCVFVCCVSIWSPCRVRCTRSNHFHLSVRSKVGGVIFSHRSRWPCSIVDLLSTRSCLSLKLWHALDVCAHRPWHVQGFSDIHQSCTMKTFQRPFSMFCCPL